MENKASTIRKVLNLSQNQLVKYLVVKQSYISKIENDNSSLIFDIA